MAAPRCFLAVPVEEPALGAATALIVDLRERVPGVRWSRPEGLHLTVHFFGPLAVDRHAAVIDAVRPAASELEPFAVRLEGRGAFPPHGPPRVLWLGVGSGAVELRRLVDAVRNRLGRIGIAAAEGPHRSHCTLGRRGRGWDAGSRLAWEATPATQIPAFMAQRVCLFESRPEAGGSVYSVLAALPLGRR